jgi:hypothetical protein
MSAGSDVQQWARANWDELNKQVGACPGCNEMNEDLSRLALRATRTGVTITTAVGVIEAIELFRNWPEPILKKDAITNLTPLTVECQVCGLEYQPKNLTK